MLNQIFNKDMEQAAENLEVKSSSEVSKHLTTN